MFSPRIYVDKSCFEKFNFTKSLTLVVSFRTLFNPFTTHDASRHSRGFSDVMTQGIIFWCLLDSPLMDLLHARHQSVNQTWPVIVAFGAAPPSYIQCIKGLGWYIAGKYKVTKIVCLPQQTAISLRVALSNWVRQRGKCDLAKNALI